jgi:hypothetical protein
LRWILELFKAFSWAAIYVVSLCPLFFGTLLLLYSLGAMLALATHPELLIEIPFKFAHGIPNSAGWARNRMWEQLKKELLELSQSMNPFAASGVRAESWHIIWGYVN